MRGSVKNQKSSRDKLGFAHPVFAFSPRIKDKNFLIKFPFAIDVMSPRTDFPPIDEADDELADAADDDPADALAALADALLPPRSDLPVFLEKNRQIKMMESLSMNLTVED